MPRSFCSNIRNRCSSAESSTTVNRYLQRPNAFGRSFDPSFTMCRLTGMDFFQASSSCSPLLLVALTGWPDDTRFWFFSCGRPGLTKRQVYVLARTIDQKNLLDFLGRNLPKSPRLGICRPILLKLDHLVENRYSLRISHNPQNTQTSLTISVQYARKKIWTAQNWRKMSVAVDHTSADAVPSNRGT